MKKCKTNVYFTLFCEHLALLIFSFTTEVRMFVPLGSATSLKGNRPMAFLTFTVPNGNRGVFLLSSFGRSRSFLILASVLPVSFRHHENARNFSWWTVFWYMIKPLEATWLCGPFQGGANSAKHSAAHFGVVDTLIPPYTNSDGCLTTIRRCGAHHRLRGLWLLYSGHRGSQSQTDNKTEHQCETLLEPTKRGESTPWTLTSR